MWVVYIIKFLEALKGRQRRERAAAKGVHGVEEKLL